MPDTPEPRWLLLIHRVPPKPNYFRVKIWRRLPQLNERRPHMRKDIFIMVPLLVLAAAAQSVIAAESPTLDTQKR